MLHCPRTAGAPEACSPPPPPPRPRTAPQVLLLPPNPPTRSGDALPNRNICLVRGTPASKLRMGLLPVKDTAALQPANFITKPDHPIWNITDGEAMYEYLGRAFPQVGELGGGRGQGEASGAAPGGGGRGARRKGGTSPCTPAAPLHRSNPSSST